MTNQDAPATEEAQDRVPNVVFACVRNDGRSVAARLLTEHYAQGRVIALSAGTQPGDHIHPEVAAALEHLGLDTTREHPQCLTTKMITGSDLAITLGSLGHILPRDEPRFVERIAAALKPGGRFIFVTTEMPPLWSPRYLLSRGFNAAMHLRNAIKRPPFIMFYLTFLLPRARQLLEQHRFAVTVHHNAFPGRYHPLKVVVAKKL